MKTCCKCKTPKPSNDFNKQVKQKDGLARRCRDCEREVGRLSYLRHVEKQRVRGRAKNKKQSSWLVDYKKTLSCEVCGDKRWYVLDFHHTDKNKEKSVSSLRRNKDKCLLEIRKCSVLCSNCHRECHFLERES